MDCIIHMVIKIYERSVTMQFSSDMTQGSVTRIIIAFTLPLLFGNLCSPKHMKITRHDSNGIFFGV